MRTSLSNHIALDLPSSALNPEAVSPSPLMLSPRLHNDVSGESIAVDNVSH
ncbi:hypothetical protein [Pseudomonas fildesensis]|uniref:hypothetical protein n=1 Tax=Pseudomonas fildesensis TaxID=1674920 RepID=UPI000B2A77FD|nr:hypothetical protein [Pseudomonas fildesensis]